MFEATLSADMALSVAVVIACSGRVEQLRAALESVGRQTRPADQVIVVGSGRLGGTAKSTAVDAGANFVSEPRPGASLARNRGARAATSDIVAFLDDDAVADDDWLANLEQHFARHPIDALGGKVLPENEEADSEVDRLAAWLGLSRFGGDEYLSLDRQTPWFYELINFHGVGIGPNMAFRRSVFEQWTGFDERIGPGAEGYGGEEQLAYFQLALLGHQVGYAPDAVVRHPVPIPALATLKLRAAAALRARGMYMLLVWREYPEYRHLWYRFMLRRLTGRSVPWFTSPARYGEAPGRARRAWAYLVGAVSAFRIPPRV